MRDTVPVPKLVRWLDRGPSWGSMCTSAARYGVTRYTLVVFPPGISGEERVPLRLYRSWPIWGTAGWLLLQVLLAPRMSPGAAMAFASAVCVATVAVIAFFCGANRDRVRILTAVTMAGIEDPDMARQLAEMRYLATQLVIADRALEALSINPVEHEAIVGAVYERMAPRSGALHN
jgi:hypothetical protein